MSKLKMLLAIWNTLKQINREEKRKTLDPKNAHKYQKNIDNLKTRIEKSKKSYIDYDKNNVNEAVYAYVMFRSMDGKERAIKAYKDGPCKRFFKSCLCCSGKTYK